MPISFHGEGSFIDPSAAVHSSQPLASPLASGRAVASPHHATTNNLLAASADEVRTQKDHYPSNIYLRRRCSFAAIANHLPPPLPSSFALALSLLSAHRSWPRVPPLRRPSQQHVVYSPHHCVHTHTGESSTQKGSLSHKVHTREPLSALHSATTITQARVQAFKAGVAFHARTEPCFLISI